VCVTGSELETWYVVGAFLINTQEFQFISQQDVRSDLALPSKVSCHPMHSYWLSSHEMNQKTSSLLKQRNANYFMFFTATQ